MKKSSSGMRTGHSKSDNGHVSDKKQAVLLGKQANPEDKQDLLVAYQTTVFAALFLGYACYTYNRKSVSYALPTLMASGLLTTSSVGILSSSQNTAYAISKFLGGVLSDRISARLLFSLGLGLSGSTALLFSRTENLSIWALLWFINGFAQGAGWPACAKLLKKWFSPANFGTWWSVLTASSNVSGTVSPLLSAYIIVNHGWGASLVLAGLVSVIMAGLTLVALVDDPALVHLPDPAAEVVVSPRPASPKKEKQNWNANKNNNNNNNNQMTVGELAACPFLWILCLCYMVVFCSKTAISDWGQIYLIEELGRTHMQASQFTSAMETGGFCGGILAGIVTDRISSKLKIRGNPRLIVASVFMLACAIGLHLLNYILTVSTSQDTKEIRGSVEKLVRGCWCVRWLTLHVNLASIHYYHNKNDQENGKVRGIYPLTGVKVEEDTKENNAYYEFTIVFTTSKKIRFRTAIKKQSRAWCMIVNYLATRRLERLDKSLEATLSMKSRTGWSKMTAKLDVDLDVLYLRKGDWQNIRNKQEEAFCLKDATVQPLKSYGKTFDFKISMTSPQKKHVELQFRSPTEADRTMWCQALQQTLDVQGGLQRSPMKGSTEGQIFVREILEEVPGGKSMKEIVLKGLQAFSPKVLTRVKYFLQPHPIIHIGEVSKVYHTPLNIVTVALMNAGFTPAPQDTSSNIVFEIKTLPSRGSTTVCTELTIEDIAKVLWPAGIFS